MKKIALLPGGFKPPHAGHYSMAKWLAKNTDADVVVVKIGAKERDGITREMSLQLWTLYKESDSDPLANKLLIQLSTSNSPVRDVYDFVEHTAPISSSIYLGMGEKDNSDSRFANIGKFAEPKGIKFETVLVPPQAGGVSGTDMRGFIKNMQDTFFYNALPDHMTTMDKEDAWAIVIPNEDLNEGPRFGVKENIFRKSISKTQSHKLKTGEIITLEVDHAALSYGDLNITAFDKNYDKIGAAYFTSDEPNNPKMLSSSDTSVKPKWRRKGVATAIYDFAKKLGYKITPDKNQTVAGKKFTDGLDEDLYDPNDHVSDYMKSSEWKAGMPDGPKKDINPSYKYHRAGLYGKMYNETVEDPAAVREIDEDPQFGVLYHWTSYLACKKIIESNKLKSNKSSQFFEYDESRDLPDYKNVVFFTVENERFADEENSNQCILVVDKSKLSKDYKVISYGDPYEETIVYTNDPSIPILPYLKGVLLMNTLQKSAVKKMVEFLESKGIPYEINDNLEREVKANKAKLPSLKKELINKLKLKYPNGFIGYLNTSLLPFQTPEYFKKESTYSYPNITINKPGEYGEKNKFQIQFEIKPQNLEKYINWFRYSPDSIEDLINMDNYEGEGLWLKGDIPIDINTLNEAIVGDKMNEQKVFSKEWWRGHINEIMTEAKANTHLTHLEELVLTQGQDGYNQAKSFLYELIKNLKGEDNSIKNVSVKWDGAPALFTGINPDNGQFFVGTKSVFNKEPKINYTPQDVDMNHGHAPGLAVKLKLALQYLPPLGITGILQGDFMFDNNEVETNDIDGVSHYTFRPNTIRYAIEANSELGNKILAAKIGIIFHTTYKDLKGSGASFGADVSGLNPSSDVWFDDAYFKDATGVLLSDEEEQLVLSKINEADSINVNYGDLPMDISSNAKVNLLNTYLNSEIRRGEFITDPQRSFETFKEWYQEKIEKAVAKISPKNQETKRNQYMDKLQTFESKKDVVINLFRVSKLLSEAKNIFIAKYDKAVATKHFIDNGDGTLSVTKAEGFVAVDHTESGIKLVDRLEFSRNNFNAGKPGAKK